MPFEIPNESAAAFPDQAEPDATDFSILVAALKGDYVVSGCLVTAQGTPDMTVAVASGVVRINGASVAVSDGNVTIAAADATNPRFDLIAIDDAGVKSRVAGTASSNPVFPSIPANSIIAASVYVPANDTDIDANQIVDKRVVGGTVSHLELTGFDQVDTPTHIPIDAFDDGDLLTFLDGAIEVVASGSEGQVLTADADGIPEWADPSAIILGAYKTTDQEVTNTTLATDAQLTVIVQPLTKYQFRFVLFFLNDEAAEGVKVSIATSGGGGMTPVSMLAQVSIYDDTLNTLVAFARITALGGAGVGAGISAGSNHVIIEGAIETGNIVGATLELQFAQNATGASAGVHCEVGSSMVVSRLG